MYNISGVGDTSSYEWNCVLMLWHSFIINFKILYCYTKIMCLNNQRHLKNDYVCESVCVCAFELSPGFQSSPVGYKLLNESEHCVSGIVGTH